MDLLAHNISRREFLAGSAAIGLASGLTAKTCQAEEPQKAQIAITFDLEMSRHYPQRGMTNWDYEKGNLDEATKRYAVEAAKIVRDRGGVIHFFCVGRVLEQPDVEWLQELAEAGHLIGNHTYDHVNVLANSSAETQFRFQRSPWLVEGKTAAEIIRENIRLTDIALQQRAKITSNGFRTPGGFSDGLEGRPDIQEMLLELGFKWVSSKYPAHQSGEPKQEPTPDVYADIVRAQAEAQPFRYPSGLVEIPMSPISDVTAFRTNFWKLDYFLKATQMSITWAIEHAAVFDFLCHPSCLVVEDKHFAIVKQICDLVEQAKDRAEIVSLDKIAHRVPR